METACLVDTRSILCRLLAFQDHLYPPNYPVGRLGRHRLHHRRPNVLRHQRRRPFHRGRLRYFRVADRWHRHFRHRMCARRRKVKDTPAPMSSFSSYLETPPNNRPTQIRLDRLTSRHFRPRRQLRVKLRHIRFFRRRIRHPRHIPLLVFRPHIR